MLSTSGFGNTATRNGREIPHEYPHTVDDYFPGFAVLDLLEG
jgi:hypothetical protein